ncbi:MAG: cysteine hydrolase family protein [Armatimonadetes bacterium]|nr:cysteine hydrolase family protein [Armatimonadota bacterium]
MKQENERIIRIPCRYYRVYTDPGVPCVEENFRFIERTLPLPVKQTALVLVDVWSVHYIDSWLQRAAEITREKIVPLLQAARRIGMTVVHAPSPYITERRYPEAAPPAPVTRPPDDWPPPAFRGIYRAGEYAPFGRDPEPILKDVYARYEVEMAIAEPARPEPGDLIITTGEQLHTVLTGHRILHLLYTGFAANWCLIGRDYGIIAMNERGYNIILVRDATTGIEFHDTAASRTATAMTVREIETKYGWSAAAEDVLRGCG